MTKEIRNHKINDPFKVSGAWASSVNDLNNKEKVFLGDFESTGEIGDLGIFEFISGLKNKGIYRNKDLYGRSLDGEFFHLYNLFGTEYQIEGQLRFGETMNLMKEHIYTTFFSVSKFLPKVHEQKWDYLICDISYLTKWFPKLWKVSSYGISDKTHRVGILYSYDTAPKKEIGKFTVDNKVYTVYLKGIVESSSEGEDDNTYKNKTVLEIHNKIDGIKEYEAIKIASAFERLFMLILGLKLNLNHVFLSNDDQSISLFPLFDHKSFDLHYDEKLFRMNSIRYESIQNNIDDVIRSWFLRVPEFDNLVANYNQTLMADGTITMDFKTLLEGIENFFKDQHLSLKREIIAMIYDLPVTHIDILNTKLKQFGGLQSWINKVVDTRVNLTHGTSRKRRMTNTPDIIISNLVLRSIVKCFSLQQLGYYMPVSNFCNDISEAVNRRFLV